MSRFRTIVVALVTAGFIAASLFVAADALYRFVEQKQQQSESSVPLVTPPLLQLPSRGTPLLHRPELRGVWIHIYSPQNWDAIARTLRAHNFNAIFLRVARGGQSLYPSDILPQEAWARGVKSDQLEEAVAAAHRYGLELHAWKVCYHLGSLVRDARRYGGGWSRFLEGLRASGRLVTDSHGRVANWLNPADPRNLELEVQVAREVLSRYDVDGYHLDYIRYPDEPSFDFDYGPISRALFESATGLRLKRWPGDVLAGPLGAKYLRWQQDVITETVFRLRQIRDEVRPSATLSAAVWRNIGIHRFTVKQDWPKWARLRLVDFLVLMDYEKSLDGFCEQLEDALARVRGRVPVVAGIGSWRLSPEEVVRQVEAARQLGADGFVLFSYNSAAIAEQLDRLKQGPTRFPADQACKGAYVSFHPDSTTFDPPRGHTVFPADEPLRVVVRSMRAEVLRCRVRARSFGGEYVLDAEGIGLTPENEARVTLPLLQQPVQIEVVAEGPGSDGPVVCRSGWFVPVSRSEFRRLLSTSMPPAPFQRPAIGFYALSRDAERLFDFFRQLVPGHVVSVYHLAVEHLEPLDVLVVPPPLDLGDFDPGGIEALRRWVEAGGRCVLLGDAVGRFPYPIVFPEIGRAWERVREPVLAVANGPVRWTHECSGHWTIDAADGAEPLLLSGTGGRPVAALGRYGRGAVVLVGLGVDELGPGLTKGAGRDLWLAILGKGSPP